MFNPPWYLIKSKWVQLSLLLEVIICVDIPQGLFLTDCLIFKYRNINLKNLLSSDQHGFPTQIKSLFEIKDVKKELIKS